MKKSIIAGIAAVFLLPLGLVLAYVQAAQDACAPTTVTGDGVQMAASAALAAGWTGEDAAIAASLPGPEASYRPDATNSTASATYYGLWQISSIHRNVLASGDWRNPADNARMAFAVWEASGRSWRPWTTFTSGAYLAYLAAAKTAVAAVEGRGTASVTTGECMPPGGAGPDVQAAGFSGGSGTVADPTGTGGFVTAATRHMLAQVEAAFGRWPGGVACWDRHEWNPTSDHPQGRACDFVTGKLGQLPGPADRARGWQLARWVQANAEPLRISYIVWDAKIWSVRRASEGWRPYDGAGGIYSMSDPSGSHRDHVHISVAQ